MDFKDFERMSVPLHDAIGELAHINGLMNWMICAADQIDNSSTIDPEKNKFLEIIREHRIIDSYNPDEHGNGALFSLLIYMEFYFIPMILAHAVNTFLTYLADTFSEIMICEPSLSDPLEPDEIIDVLLAHLPEHAKLFEKSKSKVSELTKNIPKNLEKQFKKVGFTLFPNTKEREQAIYLILARNHITHNNCKITIGLQKNYPKIPVGVGNRFTIPFNEFKKQSEFLWSLMIDIDRRVLETWSIPERKKHEDNP